MERVARDDEAAFACLVGEEGPALLAFAARTLGGDRSDAEDVVQEVFVRVWRARHRWQPTARVRTYLFTIATRLCLNRLRGRRRSPAGAEIPDDHEHRADFTDRTPGPEDAAGARQLGDALRAELDRIPAAQRTALLLRCDAEMSYAEIAAALDTSAAAVESLLSRARARLRERLSAWRSEGNPPSRG